MFTAKIAHALQVAVHLDHGGDEAQVARHGLEQGEHAGGELVDLHLALIYLGLVPHHFLGAVLVALHQCIDAVVDGGFHHSAHFEQLALQLFQLFSKMKHFPSLRLRCGFARTASRLYPNRPVM